MLKFFDRIQHKSSFLFSSILAIAARFVISTPADPLFRTNPVPDSARLASLAEFHLSQTLLCKKHTLSDVQATLLLAGWGLQPGGAGPDAWLLTGHAWRMARRLGLWHAHRQDEGSSHERQAGYMQRWRTWMCLFAYVLFLPKRIYVNHSYPTDSIGASRSDSAAPRLSLMIRVWTQMGLSKSAWPGRPYLSRSPLRPLRTYPCPPATSSLRHRYNLCLSGETYAPGSRLCGIGTGTVCRVGTGKWLKR